MSNNSINKNSSDRILRSHIKKPNNQVNANYPDKNNSSSSSPVEVVTRRRKGKQSFKNSIKMENKSSVAYSHLDEDGNDDSQSSYDGINSSPRPTRKTYEMELVNGEKSHLLDDSQQLLLNEEVDFLEGKVEGEESFWSITVQVFIP